MKAKHGTDLLSFGKVRLMEKEQAWFLQVYNVQFPHNGVAHRYYNHANMATAPYLLSFVSLCKVG